MAEDLREAVLQRQGEPGTRPAADRPQEQEDQGTEALHGGLQVSGLDTNRGKANAGEIRSQNSLMLQQAKVNHIFGRSKIDFGNKNRPYFGRSYS